MTIEKKFVTIYIENNELKSLKMTNELLNGCGHTQTTITKIMDRIEKKKDLMEFEFLRDFLYYSIRKNAPARVKVAEKSKYK